MKTLGSLSALFVFGAFASTARADTSFVAGMGGDGTYYAGSTRCPGGTSRVGSPILASQWAVDSHGNPWRPASCDRLSLKWLSESDPSDCRFKVYLSDMGVRNVNSMPHGMKAELGCKVTVRLQAGAKPMQTHEQAFQWGAPPWGVREVKIVDPKFTNVTRKECFGYSRNGNNCYFAGWVSDNPSDARCKIHIGAPAFSSVQCFAVVKAEPAQPRPVRPVVTAPTARPLPGTPIASWGRIDKQWCLNASTRQYVSTLQNSTNWMSDCQRTSANIEGKSFRARCKKDFTRVWGEFDVPDASCRRGWSKFDKQNCINSSTRRYTAALLNSTNAVTDCTSTPATVAGKYFSTPSKCNKTIFLVYGEFHVPDPTCAAK